MRIKTDYATGYSRRLDTAVRQNVLWGLKQCNQNTADLIGEEFGADGYEVSYHSHPRPSHAPMGGRQYARGKARTVKGIYYPSFEKEAEPLLNDFGCLHFKFSILLGISRPAYSAEQLAEFKANDNRTFEFEGKEYTMYEGTQLQRKIETKIRKHKDIANAAKAAGDDDLRREAQEKINLLASKYHQLSKASGLPTKVERMQVSGFRRVKTKNELTNDVNGGIIKDIDKVRMITPNNFKIEGDNLILPNAISAATTQSKLQGYLLNSNHPVGKHKARVINSVLGYHYENWDELSDIIFDAVQKEPVTKITQTKHGVKYTIPISINGKKGKSMILTTVWQIDNGSNIPRFITATFNKKTIR